MKRPTFLWQRYLMTGILCLSVTACHRSQDVDDDEDTDNDGDTSRITDTATERDSDTGIGTDTNTDTDEMPDTVTETDPGTDTDTNTDDVPDTDTHPPQSPIQLILRNDTTQTVYLSGFWSPIRCIDTDCLLFNPFCMFSCDTVTPDDPGYCDIACAPPMPSVRVLEPGAERIVLWDGKLREILDDVCLSGSCYITRNPPPGDYTLQITVHPGYACTIPCEDAVDGLIWNADPDGDPQTYEATLTVPRTDDLVISIISR